MSGWLVSYSQAILTALEKATKIGQREINLVEGESSFQVTRRPPLTKAESRRTRQKGVSGAALIAKARHHMVTTFNSQNIFVVLGDIAVFCDHGKKHFTPSPEGCSATYNSS